MQVRNMTETQESVSKSLTEKIEVLQSRSEALKQDIDKEKEFLQECLRTKENTSTAKETDSHQNILESNSSAAESVQTEDTHYHTPCVESMKCSDYKTKVLRSLIMKVTGVKFTNCHSFDVTCGCPILVVEGTRVWVSYHVGKPGIVELYDMNGVKTNVEIPVSETVQRMTSDGCGMIYVTCRDEQCVKVIDTVTKEVKLLFSTEGYPNGICYDLSTDRLLLSETEGPSYFVYEGEDYNKFYNISTPYQNSHCRKERTLFGDLGYASCVAYTRNGDVCVADYIYDKVCIFRADGQLKFTFEGTDDDPFNPIMLCCDKNGLIFIVCTASRSIVVLHEEGEYLSKLSVDGIPNSIAVNQHGKIWVGFQNKTKVEVYKYSEEM